jgi:hypothetical protein
VKTETGCHTRQNAQLIAVEAEISNFQRFTQKLLNSTVQQFNSSTAPTTRIAANSDTLIHSSPLKKNSFFFVFFFYMVK